MTKQDEQRERERYRPLILMVEDDSHDHEIYGSMLCYNGFDVLIVPDGASAVRAVRAESPDLVLLDMGLPDMSGLEVCEELRRLKDADELPVIALSAFPAAEMGARARDAGCAIYLEKPVSPVEVLHRIEEIIGRAPMPGEGTPPRLRPER